MEIRQLKYMTVIAEEGSFTKAAARLFVSQPALTQQIQKLETETGSVLFDRSGKQVTLTAAGEILNQHAQHILGEVEQATVALNELNGLQRGSLAIGAIQTMNRYLIPRLISHFMSRYPAIEVSVHEASSDEVEAGVASGRFQIGLGVADTVHQDVVSEALFDEELVLIVGNDHMLADCQTIAPTQIRDTSLVQFPKRSCTRRLWESWAASWDICGRTRLELSNIDAIVEIVALSKLAAILPHLAVPTGSLEHINVIHFVDRPPKRTMGIVWSKSAYRCAASRAFADIVRRYFDDAATVQSEIAQTI